MGGEGTERVAVSHRAHLEPRRTPAELVHEADKQVTTLEWEVKKRTGKVFFDERKVYEFNLLAEEGQTGLATYSIGFDSVAGSA